MSHAEGASALAMAAAQTGLAAELDAAVATQREARGHQEHFAYEVNHLRVSLAQSDASRVAAGEPSSHSFPREITHARMHGVVPQWPNQSAIG